MASPLASWLTTPKKSPIPGYTPFNAGSRLQPPAQPTPMVPTNAVDLGPTPGAPAAAPVPTPVSPSAPAPTPAPKTLTPLKPAPPGAAWDDPLGKNAIAKPGYGGPSTGEGNLSAVYAAGARGSGPSADTEAFRTPGLLSGPGAYEEWAKKNLSKFDAPSNVENVYGSGITDQLKTSRSAGLGDVSGGAYQKWAAKNQNAFAQPGQREGLSQSMAGELRAPSNAQSVYGQVGGQLAAPGAVDKRFDAMGGAFDDPGSLEKWASIYGLDPMQESNSESLYRNADPLMDLSHDYDYQKALTEQRRSTAARGGFNSGAAEYGERDLIARTRADKAKERAALADQADQAKLARYVQGEGFASDVNNAYGARVKDAFGLATTKDEGDSARASTLADIGRTADISEGARRGQALDLATAGDRGLQDRVKDTSDLVYRSETLGQNDATENRLRSGQADQEQRARLQDVYGAASGADTAMQNRVGIQGGIAAKQQTMGQDRLAGGLNATAQQGNIDSGLLERIIGDTKNIDKLDEAGIQAMAERYGISSEQLKDYLDLAGKIGGAAVDIYSAS